MDRERLIQVFFFGFLALMAYELYALLAPFLMPIAWAILLAFMVHPASLELRKYVKSRTLTATIITIVVATGVILPAIWLSEQLVIEAQTLYTQANEFVKNGGVKQDQRVDPESALLRMVGQDASPAAGDSTSIPRCRSFSCRARRAPANTCIKNLTGVAKNLVSFVIDFSIVLMIFFYLLRDGEDYYALAARADPAARRRQGGGV